VDGVGEVVVEALAGMWCSWVVMADSGRRRDEAPAWA
jgi:hypothetical protein